jgi:PHD/YefM family antitoxin component YafN of YafNO toxin-antitoxin module
MLKVSAAEFQRNLGRYQDLALSEPVAVTSYRRDRLVLLSIEEYWRLSAAIGVDGESGAEKTPKPLADGNRKTGSQQDR